MLKEINQEVQIIEKEKFNIYKKHTFSSLLKNKIKEVQIKIKGVVWCLRKTQILSISRKNKSMRFNFEKKMCNAYLKTYFFLRIRLRSSIQNNKEVRSI